MTTESLAFLFPGAGSLAVGGIVGIASGYALKKIFKIGVFVLGCFFGGLAWLSYKGLVQVNWNNMANQTQAALTDAATKAMTIMNHTSQQLQHSGAAEVTAANLLPVAAGIGFIPGFIYGLSRG
jgi:uncharacterized membrane protein (Fun14 family)